MKRTRRGREAAWVGAWTLLVAAGTLLHHELWSTRPGLALESIGNALHLVIGPGWLALRMIERDWPTNGWAGPLAANAIGWAFWVTMVRIALAGRSRVLRPAGAAPDLSRRRFVMDGTCSVAAIGCVGGLAKGEFVDPWDLRVDRHRVPIRDLPRGLDGLRAAQISDTHLGPRIPAAYLERAMRMVLDLKPDLLLFTGDYVHMGPAFIEPVAAIFAPLTRAGIPSVGVLGNHDWYADGHAMTKAMEGIGVVMVDNRRAYLDAATRRVLRDRPAGECLCVVGLGDLITDWIDAAAAFNGLPPEMPRLVLTHHPDTSEIVAGRARYRRMGPWERGYIAPTESPPRIDLMLCGHTHGGQIRVPFFGTPLIPSRFGQRYAGGLVNGPGFPVCISRGVGMSVLPVRLGVPPEIVEITLTRA